MKPIRFLLIAFGALLVARADISVEVRSTGFGVVVLDQPVARADLARFLADAPATPDALPPVLWLRWPDGTASAIDKDVNRLLPDDLLKVYTMSSTSPALVPGARGGPATLVALPLAPFAADDWTLKPKNEPKGSGRCSLFLNQFSPYFIDSLSS